MSSDCCTPASSCETCVPAGSAAAPAAPNGGAAAPGATGAPTGPNDGKEVKNGKENNPHGAAPGAPVNPGAGPGTPPPAAGGYGPTGPIHQPTGPVGIPAPGTTTTVPYGTPTTTVIPVTPGAATAPALPYGTTYAPPATTPTTPYATYPAGTVINPNAIAPGTIIGPSYPAGIAPGTPVITNPGTTTSPNSEPVRRMPQTEDSRGGKGKAADATVPGTSTVTPAGAKIETEVKNPFDLARRHEQRVGHAANYSKLTGQLSYVHADGGLWVLRYAPLSEEDKYGGSVVLSRDRAMNSYRDGDLVSVEGQVISEKSSARLGGALYQVQSISLVDRPRQ